MLCGRLRQTARRQRHRPGLPSWRRKRNAHWQSR